MEIVYLFILLISVLEVFLSIGGPSKILLLPRGAALGGKNFNSPQQIQS